MEKQYTWSWSEDDGLWTNDVQDSVEKCIEDAKTNHKALPGTIAVGEAIPYCVNIDVETLLERLEEDAYQECGEAAEDWNIIDREHDAFEELELKIEKAVQEYLNATSNEPTFYKIEDIITIAIE